MQKTIASWLSQVVRDFGRLFEIRRPPLAAQVWEAPIVIALIGVGAILRFWGLGSWGLEGDEKTMALPTMHLVHYGSPLMPSGMFYGRAIGQLYLMAASVRTFGESEWAFRFPSVICGLVLIGISYFVGRRFLASASNMAFVASMAFLPALISVSQEARMYVFLITCLAGYLALIFQWERSNRVIYLVAAVLVMTIGIQFQTLAVFGAFVVFFPGLLHQDPRKLWQGAFAFVVIGCAFVSINAWAQSFYPPRMDPVGLQAVADSRLATLLKIQLRPLLLLPCIFGSVLLAWLVARRVTPRSTAVTVAILLCLGTLFELGLFFHVGLLLTLVGSIVAWRNSKYVVRELSLLLATNVALGVAQFIRLQESGFGSAWKTIGVMTGLPSVWTFLRAVNFSPIAWLLISVALLHAFWLIAQRKRVPDYWLFFALGVWLPLFALGLFSWYVEVRYTEFALVPLLVCAFAALQEWHGNVASEKSLGRAKPMELLTLALATVLIVNPVLIARTVNAGYSIHPDHKGAAEYIKSLHLHVNDVIVAEDSLEQTYYLGHVDYWLIGRDVGQYFVEPKNGVLHDIYTGAPLIGTAVELKALVARRDRGTIYIIGSGEDQADGRRFARGSGIFEALNEPIFEPVFLGRDGLTRIWKVRPLSAK